MGEKSKKDKAKKDKQKKKVLSDHRERKEQETAAAEPKKA